ncbi:hypothetical protein EYF80_059662 [Liparis tanakae]|uniref:Uncharacterized protein n=1 Tax=Liparis tanakae TaxID=230148 RepID=A0A4Z2EMM0_9TELE|nr:hypothetical protein EYF80_059662 [Liparis tanakae]
MLLKLKRPVGPKLGGICCGLPALATCCIWAPFIIPMAADTCRAPGAGGVRVERRRRRGVVGAGLRVEERRRGLRGGRGGGELLLLPGLRLGRRRSGGGGEAGRAAALARGRRRVLRERRRVLPQRGAGLGFGRLQVRQRDAQLLGGVGGRRAGTVMGGRASHAARRGRRAGGGGALVGGEELLLDGGRVGGAGLRVVGRGGRGVRRAGARGRAAPLAVGAKAPEPACSPWPEPGRAAPPAAPLCFGEPLALPGLTGRTGNGPQVLAAGEKVPPNCAMGSRGCRIWCMVCAASSASCGGSDTGNGGRTPGASPLPSLPPAWEEGEGEDSDGWNDTPADATSELSALGPAADPTPAVAPLEKEAAAALEPGARMWFRGIRSSSSLAGSWIRALISCTA